MVENCFFDPEAFRANIKSTIISFCDQVPLWVKPRCGKQLYGEWELRNMNEKNPIENLLKKAGAWSQQLRSDGIESESEQEGVEELQQEKGNLEKQQQEAVEPQNKGFSQKRGFEGDGGEAIDTGSPLSFFRTCFIGTTLRSNP